MVVQMLNFAVLFGTVTGKRSFHSNGVVFQILLDFRVLCVTETGNTLWIFHSRLLGDFEHLYLIDRILRRSFPGNTM